MGREKKTPFGIFVSTEPGVWRKKGGITKIEKSAALGKGWWVSTPKEDFINVFRTLREALSLKWD